MQPNLDSFDGLVSNPFLKGSDLEKDKLDIVVTDAEVITRDTGNQLVLKFLFNDVETSFGLNATNTKKLKEFVKTPVEVIGKTVTLKKVMATNPQTKMEVESLRIETIK